MVPGETPLFWFADGAFFMHLQMVKEISWFFVSLNRHLPPEGPLSWPYSALLISQIPYLWSWVAHPGHNKGPDMPRVIQLAFNFVTNLQWDRQGRLFRWPRKTECDRGGGDRGWSNHRPSGAATRSRNGQGIDSTLGWFVRRTTLLQPPVFACLVPSWRAVWLFWGRPCWRWGGAGGRLWNFF